MTGVDNAVTKLDARLKAMNIGSDLSAEIEALFGRGQPAQIEGLSPERSQQLQTARAKIVAAQRSAEETVTAIRAQIQPNGQAPRGTGAALTEAEQVVAKWTQEMKELNKAIADEVKALKEAAELAKAAKHIGARFAGGEGSMFDALADEFDKDTQRSDRQRVDEVARMTAQVARALNNADPEIFGRPRIGGPGGTRQSTRAALMGLDAFGSSILEAAAGQDPKAEEKAAVKELNAIRTKMDQQLEELRKRGPAHAVFAEGAIA
jgi:hypothetical protein